MAAAVWMITTTGLLASPLSPEQALESALNWMQGHPVMSGATRTVQSVEVFPDIGRYSVYVVQLDPKGYLVLNSDDRLPLVVSFSSGSRINLSDDPQNAFRVMLLEYCEKTADKLEQPVPQSALPMHSTYGVTELYGPFLDTSWNQNDPYNLFCPDDSTGTAYYDYRVPVGCVPTAFAQVLNFHRWPVHGNGSASYTDLSGSITGAHSVVFSDSYDWDNMKTSHFPSDSLIEKKAVAELMYELGVAAGADYESGGTSAGIYGLGTRLEDHFFFDPISYRSSLASLLSPMETDLRAGYSCIAIIPDHAVVVDGLLKQEGATTYHINYGWGGKNNGWWSATEIPGGAFEAGITSLKPALKALPAANNIHALEGSALELQWIVPQRRDEEIDSLSLYRWEAANTVWSSDADQPVSGTGWEINSAGRNGSCWSAGELNSSYMTVQDLYVPDASSELHFWMKGPLTYSYFTLKATTNGVAYPAIFHMEPSESPAEWTECTVPLAEYEGSTITLRFVLNYYWRGEDNQLKIDDLSITTESGFMAWVPFATNLPVASKENNIGSSSFEGQVERYTTLTGLAVGTHTLASALTDTNGVEHKKSPPFNVEVSVVSNDQDSDGIPDWWESQYFGGPTSADAGSMCSNGLNTIGDAYVAGLNPNDPGSIFRTSVRKRPSQAIVGWNASSGRVYSVWFTTNLISGFQCLESNIPWTQTSFTNERITPCGYYKIDVRLEE